MGFHLSDDDENKVVSAIKAAEDNTSAEIFAVLAERSDDYRFVGYTFLAFWVFVVSVLLVLWLQWKGFDLLEYGWKRTDESILILAPIFVAAQITAFLTGMIVIRFFPRLAGMIVPQKIAHERAHSNAVKQFLAHGIHNTKGRTGVLVFVSLQERFSEILVDREIEEKIHRDFFFSELEELINNCAKGKIADGYCNAISSIGRRLSSDFPKDKNDLNEIEDRLILL